MRNRNLLNNKLDNLEATLNTLQQIVNRQAPIETYKVNLGRAKGLVEDIRSMVEAENMSPSEINKI